MKIAEDEIKETNKGYKTGKDSTTKNKKGGKLKKFGKIVLDLAIIGGAVGLFLL